MTLIKLSERFSLLFWLCLFVSFTAQAQQLAFPGADGFGKFTTGGRGGRVVKVTNLNDSGAGSLRAALAESGARTVVFEVSGNIKLNSRINITNGDVTIAGQTAPGDGICIQNYAVVVSADNVIIRYLRFRMGDLTQNQDDALWGRYKKNIIIDHCSMSWSVDETSSFYANQNFTMQWCILSESLNKSFHEKDDHGYGGIWGGDKASFHHNLLAHHNSRNPRFNGQRSGVSNGIYPNEQVDYRNNVIYNWKSNSAYGGENGKYNMVNNYYKAGPATASSITRRIVQASFESDPAYGVGYGTFYIEGNYVHNNATVTANNWNGGVDYDSAIPTDQRANVRRTVPYETMMGITQSATEAYESVLAQAGASVKRDAVDARVVNEVRTGTATYNGSKTGFRGIIDSQNDVGGWPELQSLPAPADTDNDGMPDAWETQNGLNPNDATDRNGIHASGYTNLEMYLNSLSDMVASTEPAIYASATFSSFAQAVGAPSASQTLQISGANLTGNITVTAPANFELSVNGTNWSSSVSLTANAGSVSSTAISVRLNASAAGGYTGSLVASGGGATSVSFTVSGTASMPPPEPQSQALGAFPDTDGGFENQAVGSYTNVASHTSTTKWEASSPIQILGSGARTGAKMLHWNGASTSVKYLIAPVLTSPTMQAATSYVVQFWYKKAASSGAGDLALSGYNSITGGMSGSTGTTTSQRVTIPHSTALSQWVLFRGVMTTQNGVTVTNTYPGIKIENPQSPYFDIDDFVLYPGDSFDETAPDAATAPASSKAGNSIAINWQAPGSGVDGGGYVVVRSTSATAPVPNANGVYVPGNTMGAGNIVVYTGQATGFTDDGSVAVLASSATYHYHIFTTDKAFNYAPATSVSGSLNAGSPTLAVSGSVGSFSQNVGTPSASQSFSIAGTNLSANVQVTAPAGFQLSENNSTWGSTLSLAPSGSSMNATGYVRLNAPAAGPYSGDISVTSTGATAATLAVSGMVTAPVVYYTPATANAVVALDGTGQFSSIQAAINAAPTGRTTPYIIYIKNGKYSEKVNIPSNKPFIHLIGESVANTTIIWDDYSGKPNPAGGTFGTSNSATVTVNAPDFFATGITFENATGYLGDGPQALAINVNADRCAFLNCRFVGGQDTVLTNGDGRRNYFKNCYIDGNTDFIFGAATAVFDECVIFPRDRVDGNRGGYVTAANTSSAQAYGYVFRDCKITVNRGVTSYTLGRPWQNDANTVDKKHNKTVFLNTYMGSSISPEGWSVWNSGTNTSIITYAEYKTRNFDGSLHNVSQRVSWSKQLTDAEAAAYYDNSNMFGTWDPCSLSPALCAASNSEIAVSNFRVKKGTSTTPSLISWNISWPIAGVKYELFRSSDNVNFVKVNEQVAANDINVNFTYSDALPAPGVVYSYYVKASKEGLAAHTTEEIQVTTTPAITTTGTLNSFGQSKGTPSATQVYVVSGMSLTQGITITPPAGYEVSANGGTNWFSNAAPLVLAPTNGTVTNTTITVRLNAAAAGTFAGDIVHSSTGAAGVNVAVTGTTSATASAESVVLQHWPLTTNNAENVAARSAGVLASVPAFKRFYLSNGTTVASVPAYSESRGQAFSATANGDGSWGTAVGGPGGNLNRKHYEQFTITAADGYDVRVDSVLLTSAFYNTSSNIKLAVVYSKTGFATDSADVSGGKGLGVPLVSTANGGFNTPVVLANQTAGTTNAYAFAFAGAEGINLKAGETLSIRLYFSCGSTSTGRYAMLKDVKIKGAALPVVVPVVTLQRWPMTATNQDDATARATGIKASAPTFNNLYQSNGTTVAGVTAYSTARGQAFGPGASGNALWSTTAGGPGGSLNRNFYEEFTVSATEDYAVRVDSIALSAAFYNSSSNTKLAVSYSKNDFATSADVTGGKGPAGPMLSSANGGFATPVLLPNQTGGPTNTYRFALAGADGVTVQPGEKLTIRLYFSCGSTTEGRYAMLKDVDVKGVVTEVKKSIATVQLTGGEFTYDGTAKPAAGFAYGTGGVSDVLSPALTFVYKDAAGTVLPGTPVNAGTYTVDASFAGNSLYKAATKSAALTILKAGATVNATGGEFTYDGTAKPATAFAYGLGGEGDKLEPEVTYVYKDAAGTVLAGAPVNAGAYTVEASFAGNLNYKTASKAVSITIEKAAATVQVTGGMDTYDATAKAASGFAYGVGGEGDKLTPEVTFVYKDAAGTVLTGLPVDAGTYTVEASFAGNANYKPASAATTLTIEPRAITVTAEEQNKQWSDPDPEFTFNISEGSLAGTDDFTGTMNKGGTQSMLRMQATGLDEMGQYPIEQGSLALNNNYAVTFVPSTLTVTQEDARVTFTGTQFVNTSCATCATATVTLSATIRDISITSEAGDDTTPGDITKAKVRFINRDTNQPISGWLTVGLVNTADKQTGTVVYNWATTTGAADAASYTIGIEVDGHYTRYAADDNVIVMVAKPLNEFVVGAGHIPATASNGLLAADKGSKIQYAANVKYNKSGKNLQGRMNIIFSRTEADGLVHVYQLKGNVMQTLSVNTADQTNKHAVFTGKASLEDITNSLAPVPVAGNLTVQVEFTDRGITGANDEIGIAVWADEGGLLFSSNWTGTATAKTLLGGGNNAVTGGSVAIGEPASINVAAVAVETAADKPVAQVYPVPSNTNFTLMLEGTAGETADVLVYDLAGRKVEQFKGVAGQAVRFGDKLTYGTYLVEIWQSGNRSTIKVLKQ